MSFREPGFLGSFVSPPPPPVSKLALSVFQSPVELTDRNGGEGVGEEPNHIPARTPGPLLLIQYSMVSAVI
jgi:hypothetical protein